MNRKPRILTPPSWTDYAVCLTRGRMDSAMISIEVVIYVLELAREPTT
jgi:hypothetical protein